LVGAAALAVACSGKSSGSDGEGGGSGGSSGKSGNYVIDQVRQGGRTKLDLLVMADNSLSMADKQRYLSEAIPVLLDRLVTPICVNAEGLPTGSSSPNCPRGSAPEFRAIEDIHLGVITSSLGDHGSGDLCNPEIAGDDTPDDRALLIPFARPGLTSWDDSGFLVWDPRSVGGATHDPPGYGSPLAGSPGAAQDLMSAFTNHVRSAGEYGCGHEAQLESWYRFLVDPEPVQSMSNDRAFSVRGPVNQVVLEQRARFLRPDSVLAIVMLTDENDCSFQDENGTQGWLAMYTGGAEINEWYMPRANSRCVDPNDPACRPCTQNDPDPACADGYALTALEDHPNLRCYRMKERFGVDLKYPLERYVDALTSRTIDPRLDGNEVPNPIFASASAGAVSRDPNDVVMLGIVGVPWQDIATDGGTPGRPNSLAPGRTLEYMTAAELEANGRWDVIVGDDNGEPSDPFMVESVDPRPAGTPHPFLAGVTVTEPGGTLNAINGTEQAVPSGQRFDLQFACTFPLDPPVPCTIANERGCVCNAQEAAQQSPLCEYAAPDSDGIQVANKAYPSVRELELLRELGSSAVVASICPKNIQAEGGAPSADPNYGYNPAMTALVARLKQSFSNRCLPRALPVSNGRVSCTMMEVTQQPDACGACDAATGRLPLTGTGLRSALDEQMQSSGLCGPGTNVPCETLCACQIAQLEGDDLATCQNASTLPTDLYGYCYVDEENGAQELLTACPAENKRFLRFAGDDTPAQGSFVFLTCR
jgi:hypothetical protein